jgi:hypothetical protein
MNDKSHVSMEQHLCIVCLAEHDTGSILLDRRLRDSLKPKTTTGWGMCPACEQKRADGFIALVACDPAKSEIAGDRVRDPGGAYRTGDIIHIKREAFAKVFNVPAPDKGVCFVEPAVVDMLKKLVADDTPAG